MEQGPTTTYRKHSDASIEYIDRYGDVITCSCGAVKARRRATGVEVPVHCVVVRPDYPVADLGDRLVVLIGHCEELRSAPVAACGRTSLGTRVHFFQPPDAWVCNCGEQKRRGFRWWRMRRYLASLWT